MREDEHLQNLYQGGKGASKKKPLEEEVERYYTLLRLKLSPSKLKRVSRLNIVLLIGIISLFLLGAVLLPKPTESAIEKRELAKKPEFSVQKLFSGELTREYEVYFSDTFPMREWMVSLSAVLDESKGVRPDDVRIVAPAAEQQPAAQNVSTASNSSAQDESVADESNADDGTIASDAAEESPSAPVNESAAGPATVSNGIMVYNGRAMSLFGGSGQSAKQYANVLNTYQKELPGVQIYNAVIPTSIEFYVPEKYRNTTSSQKNIIDLIYSTLNSGIKKVDAYSALEAHKDEYLYFRTDHHWTGLGAYYAYQAFCNQAGLTPISLADTETRRLDSFIGTMYAQAQDSTLLKDPDYVDYYIFKQQYTAQRFDKDAPYSPIGHTLWGEYAKSPNSYSVFLHGDFPLISVKTGIPNGRKIMVVKESFGNAFAPYLINHYEEVYIVDQRYFQLSAVDFIKQNDIDELLFINNAFAACTPYHIQCIDGLRHQSFTPPAPKQPDPKPVTDDEEENAPVMANAGDEARDKKKTASNAVGKKKTASDTSSPASGNKEKASKATSSTTSVNRD